MESLQYKTNTVCSILNQIDQYFIKVGGRDVNYLRFEIGSEPNLYNFRLVSAYERVLRTSLTLCNISDLITDDFLERTKLLINKLN